MTSDKGLLSCKIRTIFKERRAQVVSRQVVDFGLPSGSLTYMVTMASAPMGSLACSPTLPQVSWSLAIDAWLK